MYDCNAEVTLQCDASKRGLGAFLFQNGQPVAFASKTLSPMEGRYAPVEKVCLAIHVCLSEVQPIHISRQEKDNCTIRP